MYKRSKYDYKDDDGKHREYADIYVSDTEEAKTVDTDDYIQGSKMYIIETAELYVLNREGGVWCNVTDGTMLA